MRLRSWLSFLLLTGWVWAQPLKQASPVGFPPTPPRHLSNQLRPNARVRVELTLQVDGSIRARILQGSGNLEFDRALIDGWEREWKWNPATQDGHPVPSIRIINYKVNPS